MNPIIRYLMPTGDEYEYLNKFYISSLVSEFLNVILPFQFIYLFLVMDKPEWALIPLLVEGIVVFGLEIPTGIIADRWGRKISVVTGDIISGVAWLIVPFVSVVDGNLQLLLACFAFGLEAIGQTMTSGAEEAWVVDNLIAADREDLTDNFFAREKSYSSFGGILSGSIVWLILLFSNVDISVMNALWVIAAIGQIASALIQIQIPEYKTSLVTDESDESPKYSNFREWMTQNFSAISSIYRVKPLFAMVSVILIISFATAITGDAFEISMMIKGLNPRELAPLSIATDAFGFIAPMFAVYLARKFGAYKIMTVILVVTAGFALFLAMNLSLVGIVVLFLVFNVLDDLWDPICDAELQAYIPSLNRATMGSIINQISEVFGLFGLGLFTIFLGKNSEGISNAIPDLVEAFQLDYVQKTVPSVPDAFLSLPVSDAALLIYSFVGLLSAIVLVRFPWHLTSRGDRRDLFDQNLDQLDTEIAGDPVLKKRLIQIKEDLDVRLDRYNPGEELTWWVADDAFRLPAETIEKLKRSGPALSQFFECANELLNSSEWVRKRLEKTNSPNYARLNRAQVDAIPRLIRPDVVCDHEWNPKLVELEITVGCRGDTSVLSEQYGIGKSKRLVRSYAKMVQEYNRDGKNLALITAPHPYFLDLPDDAKAFAGMLREEGCEVTVISEENMNMLRFDGKNLLLCDPDSKPIEIHVIDRFIDIYEIAELYHSGISAILDAYLANCITDVNTLKQALDEKDWMSLFWEPKLETFWAEKLSADNLSILREMIPKTWIINKNLNLKISNGEQILISELCDVKPEFRNFVVKESGTSTTSSGAQSFYVLMEMEKDEVSELIENILASGVEYIIQELVESVKIEFTAIDPETDDIIRQKNARIKLSPFFLDGELSDIRMVASNKEYAVNDADCVIGVVRY